MKEIIQRAVQGDQAAWHELIEEYRERLRRMVALRMDRRLHGRVDASDVVQETFLEAAHRLQEFVHQEDASFSVWIRFLTLQQLQIAYRRHLGAQMRDAAREVSADRAALPQVTSAALADQLLGTLTGPSTAAMRDEMKARLLQALDSMSDIDREILSLRHFEHLSGPEAAQLLGIEESAAKKRYLRALKRLRKFMDELLGGSEAWL